MDRSDQRGGVFAPLSPLDVPRCRRPPFPNRQWNAASPLRLSPDLLWRRWAPIHIGQPFIHRASMPPSDHPSIIPGRCNKEPSGRTEPCQWAQDAPRRFTGEGGQTWGGGRWCATTKKKENANKVDGTPPPKNPTMISRCSIHPQWDRLQDITNKNAPPPPPVLLKSRPKFSERPSTERQNP